MNTLDYRALDRTLRRGRRRARLNSTLSVLLAFGWLLVALGTVAVALLHELH